MSYTTIFKFNKNGDSEEVADFQNSHRGCMAIWNHMGKKYLNKNASVFDRGVMVEIWNLVNDSRITATEEIVLGTTFDKWLIRKEDISKVVKAFRDFEGVTSLSEQAMALEELAEDEDCIAVGWHQNSISCEQWFDYNCLNGDDHNWLFDHLTFQEN